MAIVDRREVIGRRPVDRAIFTPEGEFTGFKRLKRGGCISEILNSNPVKIAASDVERQVIAPIVWVARINNLAARFLRTMLGS